jgi:hypothetical protein
LNRAYQRQGESEAGQIARAGDANLSGPTTPTGIVHQLSKTKAVLRSSRVFGARHGRTKRFSWGDVS